MQNCDMCFQNVEITVGCGPQLPIQCGGGYHDVLSICLKCAKADSVEEYEKRRNALLDEDDLPHEYSEEEDEQAEERKFYKENGYDMS